MTPPWMRRRRWAVSRAVIPLACVAGALAGTFGVGVGASPAAAARIEVGVYHDNPVAGVPVLTRTVGRRSTRVISTYVTGGKLVEPSVVALARRTHARLLVSWMPDGGREGAKQPRFTLSRLRRGAQNRGLVALTKQLRGLRPAPILRPMPEPNTPWYAWSGTVNGNTPAAYVAAWKQVRRIVRERGRKADPPAVGALRPERAGDARERHRGLFPGRRAGRSGRHQRIQLRRPGRPGLDRARRPLRGRLPRDLGARARSRSGSRRPARPRSGAARSSGSGASARCRPRSRTWPASCGSTCGTGTGTSASTAKKATRLAFSKFVFRRGA